MCVYRVSIRTYVSERESIRQQWRQKSGLLLFLLNIYLYIYVYFSVCSLSTFFRWWIVVLSFALSCVLVIIFFSRNIYWRSYYILCCFCILYCAARFEYKTEKQRQQAHTNSLLKAQEVNVSWLRVCVRES